MQCLDNTNAYVTTNMCRIINRNLAFEICVRKKSFGFEDVFILVSLDLYIFLVESYKNC